MTRRRCPTKDRSDAVARCAAPLASRPPAVRRCVVAWLLALVVAVAAGGRVAGQTPRLDSLRAAVDRTPPASAARVDAMLAATWELRDACAPDSLLAMYRSALALARTLRHATGIARGAVSIGKILSEQGDIEAAVPFLREAVALAPTLPDRQRRVTVPYLAAQQYARHLRHEEAIRALRGAASSAAETGDDRMLLRVLLLHGSEAFELGRTDSAAAVFLRAVDAARRVGDRIGEATALSNFANTQEDPVEAERYYRRAMAIHEETGSLEGLGYDYLNIAVQLGRLRRDDESIVFYQKALAAGDELGDERLQLAVLGNLANRMLLLNDTARSRAYAERHLALALRLRNGSHLADAHATLANLDVAAGRADDAREHARAAHDLAVATGESENILNTLRLMAFIEEQRGDYQAAYRLAARSHEYADSVNSVAERGRVDELRERFAASERQREIDALQQQRRLQEVEALRMKDVLSAQRYRIGLDDARITMLGQRGTIQRLLLDSTRQRLARRDIQLEASRGRAALLAEEHKRSILLRNAVIAIAVLLLALAGLWANRMRITRRESELRARAAEAASLALAVETARKERDAQSNYLRETIRSRERERQRIAQSLHDSLTQEVLVIKNRALIAMQQAEHPARVSEQLATISDTASATLEEIRAIAHGLRPHQLDRLGLRKALLGMLRELDETSGMRFSATLEPIDGAVEPGDAIDVYRIVQEATTNILRHAGASEATIDARRTGDAIALEIRDNGRGFRADPSAGGMGMQGMEERAKLLGGTMHVHSAPGEGTLLRFEFPVRTASDAAEAAGEAPPGRTEAS